MRPVSRDRPSVPANGAEHGPATAPDPSTDPALIIDATTDAIVTGDPDGTIRTWNPGAERLYGYSPDEIIGRSFFDLVPGRDMPRGRELHTHVLTGEPLPEFEAEARRKDGTLVEISLTISTILGDDGKLAGLVTIARDITERRDADVARRQARQRFAGAFANAPIGMALVSLEGRFVDVNPALCELLGRSKEELADLTFQELTHPEDLEADLTLLADLVAGRIGRYQLEKRYLRPDGSIVWGHLFVTLISSRDGRPDHFVSQIQDVTSAKEQEIELHRMAAHLADLSLCDPLTGAANLRAFERALAEELDSSRESGDPVSLVLIDIDDIKAFNRNHGGLKGDQALRKLADLLTIEAPGRVFRLASDDFAVLAPGLGYEGAEALARRLLAAVTRGSDIVVCSGTATFPGEGENAKELLERASAAVRDGRAGHEAAPGDPGREAEAPDGSRAEIELAGVTALVAALEARDHYTAEHSRRVVELATAVARRLGLSESDVEQVEQVAVLHDIGKVAVPDSVLQKNGALTPSEWELMRQHPGVGERIVASLQTLSHLAPPIRAEHERYDGGGYPDGLAGDRIPIESRITLACDAFHAMTSTRPYRPPMSEAEARDELRRNAGTQFDPEVIEALLGELDASSSASSSSPTSGDR
jgi:PAS domain S-box-containing protein/diguanylate cyclase (GGDEF)-like protein